MTGLLFLTPRFQGLWTLISSGPFSTRAWCAAYDSVTTGNMSRLDVIDQPKSMMCRLARSSVYCRTTLLIHQATCISVASASAPMADTLPLGQKTNLLELVGSLSPPSHL